MTTPLAKKIAAVAEVATPITPLGRFRASTIGARGEYVEIPLLGRAWIELASTQISINIDADTAEEMGARNLPANRLNALTYDLDTAARTLSACVRDPDDPTHVAPFGTLEQWLGLDKDLINGAFTCYSDVRERLNPLDGNTPLTNEDMLGIRTAIEKKDPILLRYFGVVKLSLFMLTSASLPIESPKQE